MPHCVPFLHLSHKLHLTQISEVPEEQRLSLLTHINCEHDYIMTECTDQKVKFDLDTKVKAVNHHYAELVKTSKGQKVSILYNIV